MEDDTRNLAIELGQLAGDWQLLARLVEPQLSRAPRAASSWLFKVMVAARATPKAVGEAVAAIPEELEGKVQEVTQIATLELQHGHKERALRRLYVMRRRHMDSAEAAMAHLIAHVAVTEDLPLMEDSLEVAGPGTSVSLITDEGAETVFTVEPVGLPDLPPAQGFGRSEAFARCTRRFAAADSEQLRRQSNLHSSAHQLGVPVSSCTSQAGL